MVLAGNKAKRLSLFNHATEQLKFTTIFKRLLYRYFFKNMIANISA